MNDEELNEWKQRCTDTLDEYHKNHPIGRQLMKAEINGRTFYGWARLKYYVPKNINLSSAIWY